MRWWGLAAIRMKQQVEIRVKMKIQQNQFLSAGLFPSLPRATSTPIIQNLRPDLIWDEAKS